MLVRSKVFAVIAMPALLAAATPAVTAELEDVVKYRQSLMSANGGAMGAMAAIVKGKVDYGDALVDSARALNALTQHIELAFPEGSLHEDSRAKPEIWQNWGDFQDAAQAARDASASMLAAAESGDSAKIAEAFDALGKTCGSCHKDFRVRKD